SLLHLRVAPIGAGVEHFVVDQAPRLVNRVEGDAVRVRHARHKQNSLPMDHAGMHLQEDAVSDPSLLSRQVFHWVIALETEMHIPMEVPASIHNSAAFVTTWGGNFYT